MRRIVKAATVSAIAAGLLSLSASSALAGGYEFDKEKAATHVAQCVLSETTISSGLLPDDPIGTDPIPDPGDTLSAASSVIPLSAQLLDGGDTFHSCMRNKTVIAND